MLGLWGHQLFYASGIITVMDKEYGKLTTAQFRGFVDQLPTLQRMAELLRKEMEALPEAKWNEILTEDFSWAWVYEFPLSLHVAIVTYAINLGDWINEVAASDDPQQRVLDDLHKETSDEFHPDVQAQHGLGLVVSVTRTIPRWRLPVSRTFGFMTCATRGPHGIARRERLAMSSRNWAVGNPERWWIAMQSMGRSIWPSLPRESSVDVLKMWAISSRFCHVHKDKRTWPCG